jgi:hypothetical protein
MNGRRSDKGRGMPRTRSEYRQAAERFKGFCVLAFLSICGCVLFHGNLRSRTARVASGLEEKLPKRTRKVEPRYAVNVSMHAWDIAKASAAKKLEVHGRDGLLGTIEIGQGTFGWRSARRKSGIRRIPWKALAEILDRRD